MPERLSDDLLQKLRDSFMVRSDSTSHGVILAIDELLAIRAQRTVGPVMPETPSDAVISAAVNDVVEECIDAYWVRRIYRAIRSALPK